MRLFIFALVLLSLSSIQAADPPVGAAVRATIDIVPLSASSATQLIDIVENDKGFYLVGNLKGEILKPTENYKDFIVNLVDSQYQAFVISYDLSETAKFQWSRQTTPANVLHDNCSNQFTAAVAQDHDIYLALNSSGEDPVAWGSNPIVDDDNVYILEIDDSRGNPTLLPSVGFDKKGLIESMIWVDSDDNGDSYLAVTGSEDYISASIYSNGTHTFANALNLTNGVYVGDFMDGIAIITSNISSSNNYSYVLTKDAGNASKTHSFNASSQTLQDYDMAEGSIFGLFINISNSQDKSIVEIKDDKKNVTFSLPTDYDFCEFSMIRCFKHHSADSSMLILLAGNHLHETCQIKKSSYGSGFWAVVELDMTHHTTKYVAAETFSGLLHTISRRLYGANSIYAATVDRETETIQIYEIALGLPPSTMSGGATTTTTSTTTDTSTATSTTTDTSTATSTTTDTSTATSTTTDTSTASTSTATTGINSTSTPASTSTSTSTTTKESTITSLSTTIETTTSTTNGTEEGKPEAPSGKSIVIFLIFSFIILAIVALGYVWYNRQRIAGLGIAASTPMRRLSNLASSA